MKLVKFAIVEEVRYELNVELDDDVDPDSEEAHTEAESEFCGLANPNDRFVAVLERSIAPIQEYDHSRAKEDRRNAY
jgi:hypothetical protein